MVASLDIEDFDPDSFGASIKQSLFLEISPLASGETLGIPVLLVNGRKKGRTLVAIAGIHGDEFEGIQAIHEVYHQLEPAAMSGRLLAIPIANVPAYQAGRRLSPIDYLNLARVFPGKKDGTATERIAYHLSDKIIARADLFIDLHSGGIQYAFPPLVGYDGTDTEWAKVSGEAALIFGTPVVWRHPRISPGRTLSEASRRGIPWLYTEASGGVRVYADALRYYVSGLLNLLKYLKIISGTIERQPLKLHLVGEGDIDRAILSSTSGFFVPQVRILDRVRPKQVIGLIRDLYGRTVEEIRVERKGYVVMLRTFPLIYPGEPVCLIADRY